MAAAFAAPEGRRILSYVFSGAKHQGQQLQTIILPHRVGYAKNGRRQVKSKNNRIIQRTPCLTLRGCAVCGEAWAAARAVSFGGRCKCKLNQTKLEPYAHPPFSYVCCLQITATSVRARYLHLIETQLCIGPHHYSPPPRALCLHIHLHHAPYLHHAPCIPVPCSGSTSRGHESAMHSPFRRSAYHNQRATPRE